MTEPYDQAKDMPDESPGEPRPLAAPEPPESPAKPRANWQLRILVGLVVIIALVAIYLWGVTVMPRWWAQRVGNRVDGSLTTGTLYGLFLGFVFTLLPLLVLRQIFRKGAGGFRILLLVVTVVLAVPNLLTLGIVLGNGDAAHAGDRTLDVDGPGFRAGSAWGAGLAVVVAVALFAWLWRWRRDRRQLAALRQEKAERDAPPLGE